MFDSPAKLKNFIKWCQDNKVKVFKNKDIEFELSEIAFIPDNENFKEIKLSDDKTFSDLPDLSKEEEEELLFWSANKVPGKTHP
jgi:hypothetical protein